MIFNIVHMLAAGLASASVINLLQCSTANRNVLGRIGSGLVGIATGAAVISALRKIESSYDDIKEEAKEELKKIEEEAAKEEPEEEENYILINGVKYYAKEETDERDNSDHQTGEDESGYEASR